MYRAADESTGSISVTLSALSPGYSCQGGRVRNAALPMRSSGCGHRPCGARRPPWATHRTEHLGAQRARPDTRSRTALIATYPASYGDVTLVASTARSFRCAAHRACAGSYPRSAAAWMCPHLRTPASTAVGRRPPVRKSGRGLPHSKTLTRLRTPAHRRKVLECGSPLPLSGRPDLTHWLTGSLAHWLTGSLIRPGCIPRPRGHRSACPSRSPSYRHRRHPCRLGA